MQSSSGRIAVVMEAGKLRATKSGGHAAAALHCPSWDRTRTLLIQSQACCQLHQGAENPPNWMTVRRNPCKIAVVGCCFNPSSFPPERTLSHVRWSHCAEPARRALLFFPLFLTITSCRDTFAGFGAGARARASSDQLFGAFAQRYADVSRNPKYEYARIQITHNALAPSRVFGDSGAWTHSSGPVR